MDTIKYGNPRLKNRATFGQARPIAPDRLPFPLEERRFRPRMPERAGKRVVEPFRRSNAFSNHPQRVNETENRRVDSDSEGEAEKCKER